MTPKNLTTSQKLDLILEKVTNLDDKVTTLDEKVTTLQKNQNDLIKTVSEIALLAAKTADKLDEHCALTDHSDESRSFTPFKSGAFVA